MRIKATTGSAQAAAGRRRGSLALELLLLMPVLTGILLAIVEIGMLEFADQQLTAASREGARVAAQGGDEDDVELAVRRYLGRGRLGDVHVDVDFKDRHGRPLPSGEPIEVRLSLPANHAVPDLLRFVGFSIKDKKLIGRTVMRKE
jgi:hypothetical protein